VSNTIDEARKLIAARLVDLEAEAKSLEAALASLNEGDSSDARRRKSSVSQRQASPPRKSATRRRKSKRKGARAPRGQRRQQFLAELEKSPGAKASEVAKAIGINANQAYTLAGRLQKEGAIRKSGKGYRVKAAA
jgi:hypothetical protein